MSFWTSIRGGIEDTSEIISPIIAGIGALGGIGGSAPAAPATPPPTPTNTDVSVTQAEDEEASSDSRGFASTILAGNSAYGAMGLNSTNVARSVLLGS